VYKWVSDRASRKNAPGVAAASRVSGVVSMPTDVSSESLAAALSVAIPAVFRPLVPTARTA
jgi:hypothetical protein